MTMIIQRRTSTLILLLAPLVYFHEIFTQRLLLAQGDGWTAYLGLRVQLGQMLARGELPLWNPLVFGGTPMLASIYTAVLNPINWLFAVLPAGAAMNLVVLISFWLGLAGAYRYARSIGCARYSALITALAFGFCGYLVMSLGQTSNLASAVWLPWVLLALEKLWQRITARWLAWGAIFIAWQFFSGVPQMSWYTALTATAYVSFTLLARPTRQSRGRFLLAMIWLAISAALLSAIQLLPLRELQLASPRAAISYHAFAEFSFPLKQTITHWLPYFYGGGTLWFYTLPYRGADGIYVTGGYVGLLTWLLALVALVARRTHAPDRARLVCFWLGLALGAQLLAYGGTLPFGLNHWLHRLPVYNLFRASFRHMIEFDFALAVLAGLGAEALPHFRQATLRRWLAGASVLFAALCAYFLWFQQHWQPLTRVELWQPLILFTLSVVMLWRYAQTQRAVWGWALGLVLFLDLLAYGYGLSWRSYRTDVAAELADPPTVAFLKAREPAWHTYRIAFHSRDSFGGASYRQLNVPNHSVVRGLASVQGYDVLRLNQTATVLGAMTEYGLPTDTTLFSEWHRGLDLFNVKYLLTDVEPPFGLQARWQKVTTIDSVTVYENQLALPRAWFVERAQRLPETDILNTLRSSLLPDNKRFDPRQLALLTDHKTQFTIPEMRQPTQAHATVMQYAANHLTLRTESTEAGLLVLSEVDYPGWEAWLDGQRVPLLRANYVLRSVVVPAGTHQLQLRFRPASLRTGAWLSLAGILLLLGGMRWARRMKS